MSVLIATSALAIAGALVYFSVRALVRCITKWTQEEL